jgi:hypothetical protein
MKKFVLILICINLFLSSQLHTINGQDTVHIEKIAVFPILIGQVRSAIIPLVDAAMFDEKTIAISKEIMSMENSYIEKMRKIAATILQVQLRSEVLYGDTLYTLEAYKTLSTMYNYGLSLATGDPNFPLLIKSPDDINPFQFEQGNVTKYFNSRKAPYKDVVEHICNEIDVDALAVIYSHLRIISVTAFGATGMIQLVTYLYIINKNGSMLLKTGIDSKSTSIKGKELIDYKKKLEEFPIVFREIFSQ